MRRLQLKLLGGFEARIVSGPVLDIAARKTRALLAYLALPAGRPHSRDKLVGLLWSDRGDEQARNSLRQALTELGKALGAVEPSHLVKQRDSLALDPANVEVDALIFEELAAGNATSDLRRAAELYTGDLLDGLDARDAAFEEWLTVERQRMRVLAATVLKKLLTQETGASAIAVAHRLLALDPLQEDGHRALMRLHAEAREISTALQQYERCRKILKSELDVTPSPETTSLYHSIRQQSEAPASQRSQSHPAMSVDSDKTANVDRETTKPSIAVLPFTNMSGDPEQEYFSDGITDDIITDLSRFRSLFVIARNSSFQYKGKNVDVRQVARELGVQYVVEGSIRRIADRLRVTAQLIDAKSGSHLWAERYDRGVKDIFAVQDEVTQTIVSRLAIRLEDQEFEQTKRRPPGSIRAYDHWLRGKKCLNLWTAEGNAEARRYFEQAMEIDPEFARAHAGLAFTYEWGSFYSAWDAKVQKGHDLAERHARQAVALDDTDPQPHVVLGWIHGARRETEQVRKHFDRAIAINPNDADTLINAAMALAILGEPEEGLALVSTAIRLNPNHPDWYFSFLGGCHFIAGHFVDTIAAMEKAPDALPEVRAILAAAYAQVGRLDEARTEIAEFVRRFPSHWTGQPSIQFVADTFRWGRQESINRLLDGLRKAGLPE